MAILTDIPGITIDGNPYNEYDFLDIVLVQELLTPNELSFTMHKKMLIENDGDAKFTICKELLGAKVVCKINTHKDIGMNEISGEYLEFTGIIIKANGHRSTRAGGDVIEITAYSHDYLLYDNPHCQSYEETTLKDIVTDVLSAGLSNDSKIEPGMTDAIPYTVRYNENSYQFLSRLARRYGEWFYCDGATLVFGQAHKEKETVNLIYPNVDLYDYQYNVELEHPNFQHATHDYLSYQTTSKKAIEVTESQLHHLTNEAYNKSKEIFKKNTFGNLHHSAFDAENDKSLDASLKAQGLSQKAQLMVCSGRSSRADLRLGAKIKITEKYKAENKTIEQEELIICKLVHSFNVHGDYVNEFAAIPAKSQFPPYSGTGFDYPMADPQRAIVKDNQDPEKLGRIRVQFLWQEPDEQLTPWLRITQPHGGDNKGFYFIPEIDEEVMVGFEMGNAEKPYILGTLYHGQQRPGNNWYSGSNDIKAIRTRNGHTVEIHDVADGGFIRIYDNEKENYILTFSTDEKLIKLESTGNIELYAENDIIMKAKNDINMEAGNNINMKAEVDMNRDAGENITETAGKNISVSAGEDISVNAGNDMDTSVGNNDSLYVGSNQTIEIGSNKDETIAEKFQLTAENIREEANQKIQIYSQTHEQKADKEMKLDGGGSLDLYASTIKIN